VRGLHSALAWLESSAREPRALENLAEQSNNIVCEYTSANLTVKTDRLMGINGIIHMIKKRIGYSNLAGLWKEFFVQQLLWTTNGSHIHNGRAPTWSWLSVDASINYLATPSPHSYNNHWLSNILDVEVRHQRRDNSREEYRSGRVRISGPLLRITKIRLDRERQFPKDLEISQWPEMKYGYYGLDRIPSDSDPCFH
jgi:hypothetical protein